MGNIGNDVAHDMQKSMMMIRVVMSSLDFAKRMQTFFFRMLMHMRYEIVKISNGKNTNHENAPYSSANNHIAKLINNRIHRKVF
jgi:hypothetical protein